MRREREYAIKVQTKNKKVRKKRTMQPDKSPNLFNAYSKAVEDKSAMRNIAVNLGRSIRHIDEVLGEQNAEQVSLTGDVLRMLRFQVMAEFSKENEMSIAPGALTSEVSRTVSVSEPYDTYMHNPELDGPEVSSSIARYKFQKFPTLGTGPTYESTLFKIILTVDGYGPDTQSAEGVWFMQNGHGNVVGIMVREASEEDRVQTVAESQIRRAGEADPEFVKESIIHRPRYEVRELTEAEYAELDDELAKAAQVIGR